MASLYEIGVEYENSALLLRRKIAELKQRLKNNPENAFQIERDIHNLERQLTDCNKLARFCKKYYEKGFYTESGAFAGETIKRHSRPRPGRDFPLDIDTGAYSITERGGYRVPNKQENIHGTGRHERGKQKHHFSELLQGVESYNKNN